MKNIVAGALIAGIVGFGAAGTAHAGTPAQNAQAMNTFSSTVGVATTTGGLAGMAVGAAAGCIIGGVVTVPTVVFVPLGCLTTGVLGASIGGVAGTLIVGGPVAIIAGVQMVQVLVTP